MTKNIYIPILCHKNKVMDIANVVNLINRTTKFAARLHRSVESGMMADIFITATGDLPEELEEAIKTGELKYELLERFKKTRGL